MANPANTRRTTSLLERGLALMALSGFAVAQPLFDILIRNSEFLAVHDAGVADIVMLVTLAVFGPVAVLLALESLVGIVSRRWRDGVHSVMLGALVGLALLPMIDRISGLGGALSLAVACCLAVAAAAMLLARPTWHRPLAWLALGVPVFVTMFLGDPGVRSVMQAPRVTVAAPAGTTDTPVVFVVFDELPLSSLLDEQSRIDRELYPNFAALADQAYWYPRATTISGATLRSVPAILSGRTPGWKQPPNTSGYPHNLFTILGATHRIIAKETQTTLCPEELLTDPAPPWHARQLALLSDLWVVYQHVVVPAAWRESLVPISTRWSRFREDHSRKSKRHWSRPEVFRDFVAKLEPGPRPLFGFMHILLPHGPYRLLPDGTLASWREKEPIAKNKRWSLDPLVPEHSYRRHLIQLVCTDGLLGELMEHLRNSGLYDDCLLVVTADHGACFRSGDSPRWLSDTNAADILSIPLLIKAPGQSDGVVDTRLVQTIDILPTMLDMLGLESGEKLDGVSWIDPARADRDSIVFLDQDRRREHRFGREIFTARDQTVARRHALRNTHVGLDGLFAFGPHFELVGCAMSEVPRRLYRDGWTATIDDAELYIDALRNPRFVPAEINGTLEVHGLKGRVPLAIAVNGTIAAVTETYLAEGPEFRWHALARKRAFMPGRNRLDVFVVDGVGDDLGLIPVYTSHASLVGTVLGGRPVAGVRDAGFHGNDHWGSVPTRWTDGHARLEIPLLPSDTAGILVVHLMSSGPAGARLQIRVANHTLFEGAVPEGEWHNQFDLPAIDSAGILPVEIISSTFVPKEALSSSGDTRTLGVAVAEVKLLAR